MQVMKKSWQSSIAAALVTAVMAPTASWAQIAEADVEQEVEIEFAISEDDGEVRRKIRLLRAREDELEERRERERGPRPRIRIRREIRIETDQPREVRRQALENARKEIRAQLNKLRFGRLGDVSDRLHEELQRIERNLEELHEHEDERHFVAREHRQQDPQAVQRRLQHIHAAIENLRAAGMHERAEQLQQEARKEWNFQNQWWKNPIVEQHVLRADRPVGETATRPRNVASPSQHREILRLRRDMDQMRNQMHEMQALLHRLLDRGDSSLNLDRDHDDEGHYRGHDEAEDHDDDPFGDH